MEGTIATIMIFAGNFAPKYWEFCQGQIMSISQNTPLFSLIGTTYGGDGVKTFALPDMRNLLPEDNNGLNYIICVNGIYPSRM
jgi:microcystin-dependent protein